MGYSGTRSTTRALSKRLRGIRCREGKVVSEKERNGLHGAVLEPGWPLCTSLGNPGVKV